MGFFDKNGLFDAIFDVFGDFFVGEGERFELLSVKTNRKRAYHINIDKELDKLVLCPLNNWGEQMGATVISFDFD